MNKLLLLCLLTATRFMLTAQQVPSREENISFIVTFGKAAAGTWGDDDHVQTYFIGIPSKQREAIYLRVFDPDCGGKNDQINSAFNTHTKFSIYGGNSCYSDKDARDLNPIGNYKSGVLIATKTFSTDPTYDDNWYTFGPLNPKEGEFDKQLDSYIFKIIAEGLDGDDGNVYRYFLSSDKNSNIPVEGGNFFAYEITFRLITKKTETAHLYPFIGKNVVSIKQNNFDFDNDGNIRLTSVSKKSQEMSISGDGEWKSSIKKIDEAELNTTVDLHFIKMSNKPNDMTFYVTNQYNEVIPFFSAPIGGVPKYKYKVDMRMQTK
jgi:hypothetical protein